MSLEGASLRERSLCQKEALRMIVPLSQECMISDPTSFGPLSQLEK